MISIITRTDKLSWQNFVAWKEEKKGMDKLFSFWLNNWKFTIYVNNEQPTYQKHSMVLLFL